MKIRSLRQFNKITLWRSRTICRRHPFGTATGKENKGLIRRFFVFPAILLYINGVWKSSNHLIFEDFSFTWEHKIVDYQLKIVNLALRKRPLQFIIYAEGIPLGQLSILMGTWRNCPKGMPSAADASRKIFLGRWRNWQTR